MEHLHLPSNKFYIVMDEKVCWIEATYDYFGVHLHSDNLKFSRVYNEEMEGWIYELDGIYFNVGVNCHIVNQPVPDVYIEFFERDDQHPIVVTEEDLKNETYWDNKGPVRFDVGDVIYRYYNIDEEAEHDK